MMLCAESIDFGYTAERPVLRAVAAGLSPGRVTAILGPNGAGKSTLLRVLLGLLTPRSGRVTLDGIDVGRLGRARRARRLVYIPQQSSLAFAFSVRAAVGMGLFAAGGSADAARVGAALERLGLAAVADTPVGLLSAGQQQRVTMARALAQLGLEAPPGTRALLADEPVAAMDPGHALGCLSMLRGLARGGLAVGVVLHDVSAVLRFADDVVVLSGEGTVAAAGPVWPTVSAVVLGRVFGVPFREIRDHGRAVAFLPEAATENSP